MFPQYNKTAAIHRLSDQGSGKRDWTDTGTTIKLFLQPADAEDAIMYEGDISKSFKAYTEASGVRQADRLVIDSVTYEVKAVQYFDFGSRPHYKIMIEKSV